MRACHSFIRKLGRGHIHSWGRRESCSGTRASPKTGVTCLEQMKLSRLLAVSGHVNTCRVPWLFLMSINCIMTQWVKQPFVLMVKYQKHPTSSKEGYAYLWSLNTDISSVAELAGEKKKPQRERFSEIKSVIKKKTSRRKPKNQIRKSHLLFFLHLKIKQLSKAVTD